MTWEGTPFSVEKFQFLGKSRPWPQGTHTRGAPCGANNDYDEEGDEKEAG